MCIHGVWNNTVCVLFYKLNDGWAWLTVGLAGLVAERAPAASWAKGTLKTALSSAVSGQGWGAGLKEQLAAT